MKAEPRRPDPSVNVSKTHPLKEAGVLVFGMIVATGILFAGVAFFIDIAVRWVPIESEARFFGAIADRFEADLHRDAQVESLTGRLATHWKENPYQLRVFLLDEDMPNAFALPGGTLLVTRGLLGQVGSENEIAFVIGHELGHFAHRDHLRTLGRAVLFEMLLSAVGLGGGDATSRLGGLGSFLGARSFSREQERAADAFGLRLIAAEYGHVGGAADLFGRIGGPTSRSGGALASFASTHPISPARISAMNALAAESGWRVEGPLRPLRPPITITDPAERESGVPRIPGMLVQPSPRS